MIEDRSDRKYTFIHVGNVFCFFSVTGKEEEEKIEEGKARMSIICDYYCILFVHHIFYFSTTAFQNKVMSLPIQRFVLFRRQVSQRSGDS